MMDFEEQDLNYLYSACGKYAVKPSTDEEDEYLVSICNSDQGRVVARKKALIELLDSRGVSHNVR